MNNSNKLADLLRLPLIAEDIRVGDFVACVKTEDNWLSLFSVKRINLSKLPDIDLDTSTESLKLSMDYKNGSVKLDSPIGNKEPTPESRKKPELTIGQKYRVISIEEDSQGHSITVLNENETEKKYSHRFFNVKSTANPVIVLGVNELDHFSNSSGKSMIRHQTMMDYKRKNRI